MSLNDAKQRQQAINPEASFIVQAPAGSGKTELLIQRFLALLAVVESPEHVVAVTFTRKAAGEMQSRILKALSHARENKEPETEHEKQTLSLAHAVIAKNEALGWNLFASPSRLRVLTIDALSSSLVKQMPLLAGTGSHPDIAEEPMLLYQQAAINTLHHLYSDDEWSSFLENILLWLDHDSARFIQLVAELLAKREQWLSFVVDEHDQEELENTLEKIIEEHLLKLRDAIPEDLQITLASSIHFAAENCLQTDKDHPLAICNGLDRLPDIKANNLSQWLAIQSLLLTSSGDWRKKVNKRDGFPAPSSDKLREHELKRQKESMHQLLRDLSQIDGLGQLLLGLKSLPAAKYEEQEWYMVNALHRILHLAVAELSLVFQQNNRIDFTEITLAASRALEEDGIPTDLALYLDYQIHHVLVDEFQDISTSQYSLLRSLTSGWSADEQRSLFLVGDPMQSIYRFREAEVGLFIKTWHQQTLGQVPLINLKLTSNFRSSPTIIQWVNHHFSHIFPKHDDVRVNAVSFSACVPSKSAEKDSQVKIHPHIGRNDDFEANELIKLIKGINGKHPDQSVAILVRSRNHLNAILPLLISNNIDFHATDIANLSRVSLIQDLLAITRSYLYLNDRIAWLSVLRAPWCGLSLQSLQILTNPDRERLIWHTLQDKRLISQLSSEEQQRLHWVCDAFDDALKNKHRCSLRRAVEGLWYRLYGPCLLQQKHQLDDAEKFFTLLDDMSQGGELSNFHEFIDRINTIYSSYGEQQNARVVIMTMHKAKGLEFDHVIIPGLGKRSGQQKNELMMWSMLGEYPQQKLVLAPIKATGEEENRIYRFLKEHDRQKQYYEDARLFYVATTRAKHSLHLFGNIKDKRQQDTSSTEFDVDRQSLFGYLWPQVQEELLQDLPSIPTAAAEENTLYIDQRIRRRRINWEPPSPEEYFTNSVNTNLDSGSELLIEYDWAGENIKRVGTAVHRFIQSMAENKKDWKEIDFSQQTQLISAYLYQLGVSKEFNHQATQRVIDALQSIQNDDRSLWIFDHQHQAIENEFSLSGFVEGKVRRIKIDRTFIDNHKVRWIIDYKSSRHDAEGLESFLDQEQLRYEPQLNNYAAILQQYDKGKSIKETRLGLYFPLLKGWREWKYMG